MPDLTAGKEKAVMCWSGGKDSALTLFRVLQSGEYEVKYLLTTLNENFKRISMHGVREELLDKQAECIGIPLVKVFVKEGTNKEYEQKMAEMLLQFKAEGINSIIFGDIFLEDLRAYREKNLEPIGMQGVFPIWKQNTSVLIHEFLSHGFKTITCCVNDGYLGKSHVGKIIDEKFITELPENVDPCGENGEFHTFVFEGPLFKNPIKIEAGEKVYKPLEIKTLDSNHPTALTKTETKGFWYCDIQDARKTPHKPAFSIYN